jgi:hypothetical protein
MDDAPASKPGPAVLAVDWNEDKCTVSDHTQPPAVILSHTRRHLTSARGTSSSPLLARLPHTRLLILRTHTSFAYLCHASSQNDHTLTFIGSMLLAACFAVSTEVGFSVWQSDPIVAVCHRGTIACRGLSSHRLSSSRFTVLALLAASLGLMSSPSPPPSPPSSALLCARGRRFTP